MKVKRRRGAVSSRIGPIQKTAGNFDQKCAVCLDLFKNKAKVWPCNHEFCYSCILMWANSSSSCPLCKQECELLTHNLGEEKISLRTGKYLSWAMVDVSGFEEKVIKRCIATAVATRQQIFYVSSNVHSYPGKRSLQFRIYVYKNNMWATDFPQSAQLPDTSLNVFRSNQSHQDRLLQWINRDLQAICTDISDCIDQAIKILSSFLEHGPGSAEFKATVAPFVDGHINHFCHELEVFACTNYSMSEFDFHAVYSPDITPDDDKLEEETFETRQAYILCDDSFFLRTIRSFFPDEAITAVGLLDPTMIPLYELMLQLQNDGGLNIYEPVGFVVKETQKLFNIIRSSAPQFRQILACLLGADVKHLLANLDKGKWSTSIECFENLGGINDPSNSTRNTLLCPRHRSIPTVWRHMEEENYYRLLAYKEYKLSDVEDLFTYSQAERPNGTPGRAPGPLRKSRRRVVTRLARNNFSVLKYILYASPDVSNTPRELKDMLFLRNVRRIKTRIRTTEELVCIYTAEKKR